MNNLRIIGFDISNFKRIELFRYKIDNQGLVTIEATDMAFPRGLK